MTKLSARFLFFLFFLITFFGPKTVQYIGNTANGGQPIGPIWMNSMSSQLAAFGVLVVVAFVVFYLTLKIGLWLIGRR